MYNHASKKYYENEENEMRSSSPASPKFKSNPEVTEQPVTESSERKQVSNMECHIENGNASFRMKDYEDAVRHYRASLNFFPEDHSKAEVYRRIALNHKMLGDEYKVEASSYTPFTDDYQANWEYSVINFKNATRCLKQALGEDKKNQSNIGQIVDHFALAKTYLIKSKFRSVLKHVLAGMELNLARKPEHACMLDAEGKDGHAILLAFLDKVPQKRWAIPYHEQVITMLKKCQVKYPNSGFEETIKSAEIKLEALKILRPDDAPERPCRVLFSRKNEENANGLNTDRFVRPDVGSLLLKGSMFGINLDLAAEQVISKGQNRSCGSSKRQKI